MKNILGYSTFGKGTSGVIVLHDWMGDAKNYEDAIRWLDGSRFTYLFADIRGYGRSAAITIRTKLHKM